MALKMHDATKRAGKAQQQRGRQSVRVFAATGRLNAAAQRLGLASVDQLGHSPVLAAPSSVAQGNVSSKGIVQYMVERRATPARSASAAPGQPSDAVVLSVLQNYSGLTVDRLFNMLRNSGKFNESQSTLNSILSSLVSQGKVQNERGTFRFVSNAGNGRSPSPAPSRAAPARAATPSAASAGDGKSASDEATVLAVLANYSGLTEDRLSSMLRNSGKSTQSSVSSVLSSLVSQGKVQNDRGTYRYLPQSGKTPTPARSTSPVARASSAPARPASRTATPSPGDGAASSDEAVVLAMLKNYSGLTADRLSNLLRSSGKSVGSVESVLRGLVSKGRVDNERGIYKFNK